MSFFSDKTQKYGILIDLPRLSELEYTGVKNPDYHKIPNAGYVDRKHVDYQSFGVIDMPQLFSNSRIFKPSANNTIHIAKSENDDWNIYKLISFKSKSNKSNSEDVLFV